MSKCHYFTETIKILMKKFLLQLNDKEETKQKLQKVSFVFIYLDNT